MSKVCKCYFIYIVLLSIAFLILSFYKTPEYFDCFCFHAIFFCICTPMASVQFSTCLLALLQAELRVLAWLHTRQQTVSYKMFSTDSWLTYSKTKAVAPRCMLSTRLSIVGEGKSSHMTMWRYTSGQQAVSAGYNSHSTQRRADHVESNIKVFENCSLLLLWYSWGMVASEW